MLSGGLTPTTLLAFALTVAGFGVKSFMVPFHTPLADAHAVAPSPISMLPQNFYGRARHFTTTSTLAALSLVVQKTMND